MPNIDVPFLAGDKTIDTAEWTNALPENMYFVDKPVLGREGYMASMPGMQIDAILPGSTGDRGGIFVERDNFRGHYRVIGGNLTLVPDQVGGFTTTLVSLGPIPGTKQCTLAYSFNNLAIVADGKLFYYNPTDGLRQITDPDIGSPIDITWGDNLFILTDGETVYHSEPLDEESFLPLDFATAEFRPDPSLGVAFNEDSELIVFGTNSIEYYRNVGKENFSFSRITQKAQKIGIVGTHAKGEYGNSYYVLGGRDNSSLGVYMVESGAGQKISSYAIDKLLQNKGFTALEDSIVEVIEIDGIQLCYIHMPDSSIIFNMNASRKAGLDASWSIIKSAVRTNFAADRPYDGFNFVRDKDRGLWMFGSKLFGTVQKYDFTQGADVGVPQECILYSPLLKLETLSMDQLEMETVPGFGRLEDQFSDETRAFISLTYDGVTYGKEWSLTYGIRNNYSLRFEINRLGYVPHYVGIKIRIYSKTKLALTSAKLSVS